MATLVRFPTVAANILDGSMGQWLKQEGDAVAEGEPLVEIITMKASFELESPAQGTLLKIIAPEKSAVPVNYILAVLGEPDETAPDVSAENELLMAAYRAQMLHADPDEKPAPTVRATPGARKLAREHQLDLAEVPLPEGRPILREENVRQFLKQG